MSGGEILILGKAAIWFAIPIYFAWRELRALKRERPEHARNAKAAASDRPRGP